jgi:hypothetical protein
LCNVYGTLVIAAYSPQRATPAGVINLSEIKEVTPFEDIGEFHVVTDKRTYDFKGNTRADGLTWRQAIIDVCIDNNLNVKF